MTATVAARAAAVARPDTVIEATNPTQDPSSIESHDDERRCIPGLLAELIAGAMCDHRATDRTRTY